MAGNMISNPGTPFEDEIGQADSYEAFESVPYNSIYDEKYNNCSEASHCLIYCKNIFPVLNVYNPKANVLMQMRFDGHLGFPGGVLDGTERPEEALTRELFEEMDFPSSITVDMDDRKFIHYNEHKNLLLHFFTKEVSPELYRIIERKSVKCKEFGNEVLGLVRVPLYTMCDGYRGFPAFLRNKFIGNSRQQLLQSLLILQLMTDEEIKKALTAKPSWSSKENCEVIEEKMLATK